MAISANPSAAKIEPRHLFIVFAPEANFSYRDAHGSFGRRISYRELNDLANRAAKGLQYLGSGLACMPGLSIPSQRVSVAVLPPDRALEAAGKGVSLRLWRDEEPQSKQPVRRDYETVGYVISGRAELTIEGQTINLEPGDSWLVPAGAEHSYRIAESFTAVEATAPPEQVHGRDEVQRGAA